MIDQNSEEMSAAREALARLAAQSLTEMFADFRAMLMGAGVEHPPLCFALFIFPEHSTQAALVTNSTREFALDMCREFIAAEGGK